MRRNAGERKRLECSLWALAARDPGQAAVLARAPPRSLARSLARLIRDDKSGR